MGRRDHAATASAEETLPPSAQTDPQHTESPTPSTANHLCEQTLEFHSLANLFPPIQGEEFARLVADIKTRGLLHPITTLDGKILDGRNRYLASIEAGSPIRAEPYTGDDPVGFVLSSNLHRRHLDESQRAMVAAKLATMRRGDNQHAQICATSQSEAGELLNVSRRTVQSASVVRERGTPELGEAVERGQIPVSVAAKLADLPVEVQQEAVAEPGKAKHLAKQHTRKKREIDLAAATIAASKQLGTKLYGVLYMDPPWRFAPYSTETGMDRAADNHYPTMSEQELYDLKIPAAKDCALFLWATVPMLALAMKLIEHWDFEYKSSQYWEKPEAGTGYWFRNEVEQLLVAVRGNVPAPAPGSQPPQVRRIPAGPHSAKPDIFADDIAGMFPNTPKLEMFARKPRDGWDTWGNEQGSDQ